MTYFIHCIRTTALNIRISNLSTQINELIDSGIFEAGRSTKGFLKAVQQKNELGGQLRSCQTALMKLDTLIKHIREKILTTGQEEAAAEEEALPADSFTLTYESSFTNNEQIDGIRF